MDKEQKQVVFGGVETVAEKQAVNAWRRRVCSGEELEWSPLHIEGDGSAEDSELESEDEGDGLLNNGGVGDRVVIMSADLWRLRGYLAMEGTPTCETAVMMIDRAVASSADIPLRDEEWYIRNRCPSPVEHNREHVFRLPDWRFRNVNGKPSANFLKNLRRSITSSTMILNMADSTGFGDLITNKERKEARHMVASNPYVIYACVMQDEEIAPLQGNEVFFSKLYRVRERCSVNGDLGYKEKVRFRAQGPQEEDEDAEEMFSENATGFWLKFKELWAKGFASMKNWAGKIVDLFFDAIGNFFGLLSVAFKRVMDTIKNFCADVLRKVFNMESLMRFCHRDDFKRKLAASISVLLLLAVGVIFGIDWYLTGRIADMLTRKIVNHGYPTLTDEGIQGLTQSLIAKQRADASYHAQFYRPKFMAQNMKLDPVGLAVMLGCGIWNFQGDAQKAIREKANLVMDMMKLGSVVSCTTACVFSLMPVVLKEAIAYMCETPSDRLKRECVEWCTLSNELGKLQQIPSVMASPHFREKIEGQIQRGNDLFKKLLGPSFTDVRGYMTGSLVRLYQMSTVLTSMANETLKRDEPFSVHLCGAPGIGKTLIAETLLQRSFDVDPAQIYSKNCGEDFYSGYHGQKAVIMDEFCVGAREVRETVARQYLGLISSAQTRLEMASINDPRVGIKGTCFTSDYVITINNMLYDRVEGIPQSALWRRRNVVVEVSFCRENMRLDDEGHLDLSQYSIQEISDSIWMKANVFPREPGQNGVTEALTKHPMSMPVLFEYLAKREKDFRAVQEKVRTAFGSVIEDKVDPIKLIDNVFRRANGLPEYGQSAKDFMGEWIFGSFIGQGSNAGDEEEKGEEPLSVNRHVHTCPKCKEKRRHSSARGKMKCEVCLYVSDCVEIGEVDERADLDQVALASDYPHHKVRRIKCINLHCTNMNALKSKQTLDAPWVCLDCIRDFDKKDNIIQINRSRVGLKIQKEVVHRDLDSWNKAVMKELEVVATKSWAEVVVPVFEQFRDGYLEGTMKTVPIRLLAFGLVILGALKLRSFRSSIASDVAEGELSLEREGEVEGQALYDRSTRTKAAKNSLFARRGVKGVKFAGQGLARVDALKLRIGGADLLCYPVGGRDLLLFHHSIVDSNGEAVVGPLSMTLKVGKESYSAEYVDSCVRSFPERDFMILRFDEPRLPSFRDVSKSFLTRDEIDDFDGKCLVKIEAPRKEMYARSHTTHGSYFAHGQNYEMPKMVQYSCHTLNGDCGAPVIVASGPLTGKILGIHVAGTGDERNPWGLGTFVAKEDIDELRGLFADGFQGQNMDSVANYNVEMESGLLPNLSLVEQVPKGVQMHCSDRSKLKPSLLSTVIEWEPKKGPAILSERDPRAKGLDPIDAAVKKLGAVPQNEWPVEIQGLADIACEDMFVKYSGILEESGLLKRKLTLDEAIGGVPGVIKAMDTSTCAGYPLGCTVKKSGKKSLIWHDGESCVIDSDFRRLCEQQEKDMLNYEGGEIEFAFQAFGKDELRSESKLAKVDTRLTYADDVVFNCVLRQRTAVLMHALCKTFGKHGQAIALNPQSHDMNKIYEYLRGVSKVGVLKVIDGDFSEYDIRHCRHVIDLIFGLICRLMLPIEPNESFWDYVKRHETSCGAMVKDIRYVFRSILCSGSLVTTLFNCFTTELYARTAFLIDYPFLSFDSEVRIVVLGDDHLISTTDKVGWSPKSFGETVSKLNLKYTSARKDEELKDERTPFGECLFLGSVPQRHHGLWSGALRKETLHESLLWTRNNDKTMDAEVRQMCEAATQWDRSFYERYVAQLRNAYRALGRDFPEPLGSWKGLGFSVAQRTTDSGADFPIYRAQMEGAVDAPAVSVHVDGMTTVKTDTDVQMKEPPKFDASALALKSVSERSADLMFGTRSLMKRVTVAWSSANAEGTSLITNSAPFGLLGLGDQHNLQNMAFQNFLYSTTNIKVVFQVNGTPTQAGLALAYFVPLLDFTPDRSSKPSFQKVWITPSMNTTVELDIDFQYWRSTLNNLNAAYFPEVIGYIKVDVFSPLISLAATTCDVTMYTAFEADFKIPRPFATPAVDGTAPLFGVSKNSNGTLNVANGLYVGQGSNVSTTNVNNSYQVGDIGGDMPIQAGVDGGGKMSQSAEVSQGIPMDNPPVSGGAVPTVGQFSSMSKSNGAEITTSLQLHQQQMSYQPIRMRQPLDTNIQELCGKQGYLARFAWATTNLKGTSLYSLDLNSCFSMLGSSNLFGTTQLPVNVAVLNQFMFWRGDFVFEVCAVKTGFHSGRIMASVAYGDNSINLSELNVYMNNVLDYNGEAAWQSFRVNYNNSQEYLRTWNGHTSARARDVSLGTLQFSVLNELRASSEIVSSTLDVIVFVRFENVRVAVPKPNPIVRFQNSQTIFMAQGSNVLDGNADAPDQGPTEVVDTTATGIVTAPARPCKLTFGEKFDYTVSDVHELVRRHLPLPLIGVPISKTANLDNAFGITKDGGLFNMNTGLTYDIYKIPARLNSIWSHLYAGWSGHIKFRIFVYSDVPGFVWYVPHDMNAGFNAVSDRAEHVIGMADARRTLSPTTDVFEGSQYPTNIPREMTYPYTAGCSMIDVSVPFCSQYNFLPNWERRTEVPDENANWGNGFLYLRVSGGTKIEIFQAAGDDFRFHVFCPDNGIRGAILTKVGATTTTFAAGDRIASYYV